MFQVLILRNDSGQSVEVREVESVDYIELQKHLELGESVFITSSFGFEEAGSPIDEPSLMKLPMSKKPFNGSASLKPKKRKRQRALFYVADD